MKQVLLNGRILDGLGNPWISGDLEVMDGKISRIGRIQPGNQVKVFDLKGSVVAPGFIDIHTHSDTAFFLDKHASGKICQGVTTEVVGNCGLSSAPIIGEGGREFVAVNEKILYFTNLGGECVSTEGYLRALEDNGMSQNVAALVGHTTLRASVMGYAIRKPLREELDTMRSLLAESLRAGTFGMSLGYQPGEQADEDELVALAEIVADNNGFIPSHPAQLANYGSGNPDEATYEELTSRIRQLIEVGRRANVPVQISHAKAIGPAAWGRAQWLLDLIDHARAQGIDVTCDLYGYTTGGGGLWGLFAPEFVLESAESNDLQKELSLVVREGKIRKQALSYIQETFRHLGGAHLVRIGSFISGDNEATPPRRNVNGKTFADLATEMGKNPAEIVLQFLQEGDMRLQCTVMTEQDVIAIMRHETAMICSDGVSLSVPKATGAREVVHPRNFGAYPRILKRYVREFGALSLTSAIHKMTGLPAARLGLRDRGRIEEGCNADLVVFDPQTVADRATFADPYQGPAGISYVFLNGELVVEDGKYNGLLAGKVLRKGR